MREQSKNWKNRIIILVLCTAMVLGNNFAAFASIVSEGETTATVLELETNDVAEIPAESGKDVFIRIGGEDSILTKLILTVQTEDGREQEITEGVVIKNAVNYHLGADVKLVAIKGNLDGQEFTSDLQKLKKSETEDPHVFAEILSAKVPAAIETPEVTETPADEETPEATETPADEETPAAEETPVVSETPEATPSETPAESDNAISNLPALGASDKASHGNLNQVVKDGKKYFVYDDGTYLTGWYQMMPTWKLYLDPEDNGAAVVGYKKIKDKEYVFNKDGIVIEAYGTPIIDGKKYWIVGDGSLRTGWMTLGNMKLYFDPDLKYALTGISKVGDKHYLFDKNGVLIALAGTPVYDGKKYWFQEDGALGTGWMTLTNWKMYFDPTTFEAAAGRKEIEGNKYLFDANGVCYTNSRTDLLDGKKYWFNSDGSLATGWLNLAGMQMYFYPDSDKWYAATGIATIEEKKYYFDENGVMQTGFRKMDGSTYYFQNDGSMMTNGGTPMIDGKKYYVESGGKIVMGWVQMTADWRLYFNPDNNGAAAIGFTEIDGSTYYFNKDGIMFSGFQEIAGKKYCFNSKGVMYKSDTPMIDGKKYAFDADGVQIFGWVNMGGSRLYFDPNGGGAALIGKHTIKDIEFEFDENGVLISGGSDGIPPSQAPGGQRTVKNLLQNALKPAGSTIYIWGGGHDDEDATRYGLNANWLTFFNSQNSSYDYTEHRYEYGKGLDCSGFVGWAVYNTVNTKSGQSYITTTSSSVAGLYANSKGWGTYYSNPSTFKPGDVVSMSGHTYIVLGRCSDGSMVIVHCTPPGGVQIGGTVTPSGSSNSQAFQLASTYMKKYFPSWYFKTGSSGRSYFNNITLCRWKVDGSGIMSDPEGYQSMSAEQVLKNLFNE